MVYKATAVRDTNDSYQYVIRIENDRGSCAGIGAVNGKDEADAIVGAINYLFELEYVKKRHMLHPTEQKLIAQLKSFV